MDKYKGKYRITSTRHQHWDYRWSGAYFITICTRKKRPYFGSIKGGIMNLSPIGALADVFWHEIKNRAKHISLGEFVVMPNHMHGILILNQYEPGSLISEKNPTPVQTRHVLSNPNQGSPNQGSPNQGSPNQGTPNQGNPNQKKTVGQNRFQNQGKNSISSIVGGYKSAVTKHARRLGYEFEWKPRFHDHIIRDKQAYENISNYIINNPQKWEDDCFHYLGELPNSS